MTSDITEKLKTVFRKNGLQLIRQKLNYYGHLCLRYLEKIKPLVSFTEKLMHFLIKKFLKWLLPETIVILYQVVNKNIFVFSLFYTYAYLGIILDFLAGFLLLCRSICQLFHYVISLSNESLSHTLLISYHISSSHLHKKRTFPCASLLIFYFFFSLATSYLSWLSIFSYFLRLLCFREFNILFFLVSIRINPVPRTASVPNPIIPYFQSPAPPDIGILNVAEFTTSKVQS